MTGRPIKLLMLTLFSTLLAVSCHEDPDADSAVQDPAVDSIHVSGDTVTIKLDLDSLFQAYGVSGTIIIRRSEGDTTWIHNPDRAAQGFLPASTFKIVNTLIGLETGVINTEDTLFRWDGKPRRMRTWETDMTLTQAFHTSCVPCYQDVARRIGTERMNAYLTAIGYGHMVVSDNTLDQFWLSGPSTITPLEQMDFLQRLSAGKLPVSSNTISALRDVMMILETDQYQLYGKTGWAVVGRRNIGWFVGWVESEQQTYLFVTNIEPTGRRVPENFAGIRHILTQQVLDRVTGVGTFRLN